jgi:hypothetical protein
MYEVYLTSNNVSEDIVPEADWIGPDFRMEIGCVNAELTCVEAGGSMTYRNGLILPQN